MKPQTITEERKKRIKEMQNKGRLHFLFPVGLIFLALLMLRSIG